ncbi:MAG: alanine racemase, partial [Lentisphaeria bacterium]
DFIFSRGFVAMISRVWLEINLEAIKHNYDQVCVLSRPLEVMAVLKANAYGLGAKAIVKALVERGLRFVGVAEISEALALQGFNIDVQILGGLLPSEIVQAVELGIILPVTDFETAKVISEEAILQKKIVRGQFLIDSGMGRLGIHGNFIDEIKKVKSLPNMDLIGIYSHFPSAYEDHQFSLGQVDFMVKLITDLEAEGISFKYRHMANSDGINNIAEALLPPFNMVRTGINLYGVNELQGNSMKNLIPAISLKSKIVSIRKIEAGKTIGYGRTYRLPKETLVATICAGYADGVPLACSNRGWVIINNTLCPIIGKISMDYITVSLETCPQSKVGDEVILIGKSLDYEISVEQWAHQMGTSPYHVICSFGNRVSRDYF